MFLELGASAALSTDPPPLRLRTLLSRRTAWGHFVKHHNQRTCLFYVAFSAAHMFWTKHAVATRAVERAPTLGLMVVHSILVLAMGLFTTMVAVTGAVGTKRVNAIVMETLTAARISLAGGPPYALPRNPYLEYVVFLEAIAPTLYCLAIWTLAAANLDFWAVVWRSKASK